MYSKSSETAHQAITAFTRAVQIYRENSNPIRAAGLLVEMAKVCQNRGDIDAAIDALTEAVQLYKDEDQPQQAIAQLTVVADLKSLQEKWFEAAKIYKEVGLRRCENSITQMAAVGDFARSVLCQMAGDDSVGAGQLIAEFETAYPSWSRAREHEMLKGCLQAWDNGSSEEFATAVAEYDGVKRLDPWQTRVLLVVRRLIEGDEEDLA
jgi:alpha-soluble NSF attachment protein